MEFSDFDKVIGLLEKNKDKISDYDFQRLYEGVQKFYETIENLKKKQICQCSNWNNLCGHPEMYKKCKSYKKVMKEIPVLKYFLDGKEAELQLTMIDKYPLSQVRPLISKLLQGAGFLEESEMQIRLCFAIFDIVMRSKSILSSKLKETILNKIDEFKEFHEDKFKVHSKKFGLNENILDIWEREIKNN